MTARTLLESIHGTNRSINLLLRTQARLRDRMRPLKGHNEAAAAQLQKQSQVLAEEILRLYHSLEETRERLNLLIERLPHQDEQEVLKLVYLRGFSVEDAAEVLHFSPRHTYRIKARAAARLQALLGSTAEKAGKPGKTVTKQSETCPIP